MYIYTYISYTHTCIYILSPCARPCIIAYISYMLYITCLSYAFVFLLSLTVSLPFSPPPSLVDMSSTPAMRCTAAPLGMTHPHTHTFSFFSILFPPSFSIFCSRSRARALSLSLVRACALSLSPPLSAPPSVFHYIVVLYRLRVVT